MPYEFHMKLLVLHHILCGSPLTKKKGVNHSSGKITTIHLINA